METKYDTLEINFFFLKEDKKYREMRTNSINIFFKKNVCILILRSNY